MRPPHAWHERRRTRLDGKPYRRNLWHVTLMETYTSAAWDWWVRCEATAGGYPSEEQDFRAVHPRPLLRDFMVTLAHEWREHMMHRCNPEPSGTTVEGPDALGQYAVICVACGTILDVVDEREEAYAKL